MKTFRVYISGKISSRHSQIILHKMLEDLGFNAENGTGSDTIPSIRNMHRNQDEAYFDVDIPNNDESAASLIDSMKRYIIENSVQYEDITNTPPKVM